LPGPIFLGIQQVESDGAAVPIYLENGYDQYVAQYGTNSAFFSLLGSFVQTMGPVFIAYGGFKIAGMFGTVSTAPFRTNMVKYLRTYIGIRGREAIIAGLKSYFAYVLIDATLRVICDLSPDYPTALFEVNQNAAMVQGVTDGVATYINLPDVDLAAFQAISNCVVGIVEGSNSGTNTQINNCLFSSFVSVLVSSSGNIKTILLKRLMALSSEALDVLKQKIQGLVDFPADHWFWGELFVQGAGNIFELSTFKNLTARIPSGSKLTNLKKSEFITYGYKVKPTTGGLKTQIDDIIANGDNLGAKTESIVDDIMSDNGYTKMDGKYGSNNGYDGVYIKGTIENPTEIVIIESKQFKYANGAADDVVEHGGITLNPPSGTTPLPSQMSDGWVDYVAGKLNDAGNTSVGNMIKLNDTKISKYVVAVDKTQGEINFLKLGAY